MISYRFVSQYVNEVHISLCIAAAVRSCLWLAAVQPTYLVDDAVRMGAFGYIPVESYRLKGAV
jgi:hypothetical protein